MPDHALLTCRDCRGARLALTSHETVKCHRCNATLRVSDARATGTREEMLDAMVDYRREVWADG